MAKTSFAKRSKKVEYVELIYDLIFVFLLQQDNSLLRPEADGFLGVNELSPYILSTLTVLQIWTYSVLYINRYGENTITDFIFVFANMYLLYFMGMETRLDWWQDYQPYNTAWALILINLAIQYLIKARRVAPRHPRAKHLTHAWAIFYFIEAGLVLLTIPIFYSTGVSLVQVAVIAGFVGPLIIARDEEALPVSFEHLSERVMLFVVFTFGEMIVSITEYFQEVFSFEVFALSATAFLTVIGLFRSYGYLYNHVIDRDKNNGHRAYLLLHIVVILALSAVALCLEYLRIPGINKHATAMLLSGAIISYYVVLFWIARRPDLLGRKAPYVVPAIIACIVLVIVMNLVYRYEEWVLLTAAAFVWTQFTFIVLRRRVMDRERAARSQHRAASA